MGCSATLFNESAIWRIVLSRVRIYTVPDLYCDRDPDRQNTSYNANFGARKSRVLVETDLLLHVLNISRRMTEMRSFAPLLHFATAEAIKLTGAERGYVVLPRPDGILDFRVKLDRQGNEVKQAEDQISKTVLTKVLQTNEPLLLRDAMTD